MTMIILKEVKRWNTTNSRNSAAARVAAAKSYLEAWVGDDSSLPSTSSSSTPSSGPSSTSSTSTSTSRMMVAENNLRINQHPMLVSGTSYLMATLRLEKTDTPDALAHRLREYDNADGNGRNGNVGTGTGGGVVNIRRLRSSGGMVNKDNRSSNSNNGNNHLGRQWKCPIVLDIRAWAPDGTPHYRPPPAGSLQQVVSILSQHGLAVVGVNGTPKELESEAYEELGLPSLRPSSTTTSIRGDLSDILDMVVRQQQQAQPIPQVSSTSEPNVVTNDISKKTSESPSKESAEIDSPPSPSPAPSSSSSKASSSSSSSSSSVPPTTTETTKTKDSTISEGSSVEMPEISPSATVYHGTVRSGQQIYSDSGRSLVILGSVSSGGEVLSDGDIFIMGKLRGRALAGLATKSARIIAISMDPELVAVGGVLSTGDQLDGIIADSPSMISLSSDQQSKLKVETISLG